MTSENTLQELWRLYATTVFVAEQPIPDWPHFTIVTACNPLGEQCDASQNQRRQEQLKTRLEAQNIPYQPIVAAAPDFSHIEASYLVKGTKQVGLELAREFQQNAIFSICDEALKLTPCLLEGVAELELGSFKCKMRPEPLPGNPEATTFR